MIKRYTLIIALAFLMSIIALAPNSGYAATGQSFENATATVQGSMLNAGYIFVPGTTILSPQPVALHLSSNNQPSYLESVLYSGGNPSSQLQFLPPNYNNQLSVADQPLSNSLFPSSSGNPTQTAGFIRVGNVLPTSSERQALTNYTAYPNYLASYPWNDQYYNNQNTTVASNVTVSITRYNTTMNLDQWSTFNIGQNQSMIIATTLSSGLFNAYFAQLYGTVNYDIFNQTGYLISTNSLSSGRTSYIDTFFMNQSTLGNGMVYISLWSNINSQIMVRVSKITLSPTTLSLNSPVKGSQDLKYANLQLSSDPFETFLDTQFKAFQFTVPSSLNNKFFSINFQYGSSLSLSSNIRVFSNQGRTAAADGSAILGRTGETWTIIFNTNTIDGWNYYLVVQPTTIPSYTLGSEQNYIFPHGPTTTYYMQVNISSSNYYRLYLESNIINTYTGQSATLTFQNGNRTNYLTVSTSYLNQLYYFVNGTYLLSITTSSSNRVNVRFEMDSISPVVNTTQVSLGLHDFAVVEFDNPYRGNTYNVSLQLLTNQTAAQYHIGIFNQYTSVTTVTPTLARPGNNYTSYNFTSSFWGSKLYAFVYPTILNDLNATLDRTSFQVSINIHEYNGISAVLTPSINVTPTSAGFYSFLKTATTNIYLQVNLTSLSSKQWFRVQIKGYNNSLLTGNLQFEFIQVPTISTTNAITSMSEYTVRTITGGIITSFGFGSMNTTATMFIYIHRPSLTYGGNITVNLLPQPTQTLEIGYPQLGPTAPSATGAPAIANIGGGGATPGFLFLPVLGLLGIAVIVRKIRSNRKN